MIVLMRKFVFPAILVALTWTLNGADKPIKPDNFLYFKSLNASNTLAKGGRFSLDDEVYFRVNDLQNGLRVFSSSGIEPFLVKIAPERVMQNATVHSQRDFANASGSFIEIEFLTFRRPVTGIKIGNVPDKLTSRSIWLYGGSLKADGSTSYVRVPLKKYIISGQDTEVVWAQGASFDMLRFDSIKMVIQDRRDLAVNMLTFELKSAVFVVLLPGFVGETARIYYGGPAPKVDGCLISEELQGELGHLSLGQEELNQTFALQYQPGNYQWLFVSLLLLGVAYLVFCIIRSINVNTKKSY